MKLELMTTHKIDPEVLARGLAKAKADEFMAFMIEFANVITEKKLDDFAREIGYRLEIPETPFKKLQASIDYYQVSYKRDNDVMQKRLK